MTASPSPGGRNRPEGTEVVPTALLEDVRTLVAEQERLGAELSARLAELER